MAALSSQPAFDLAVFVILLLASIGLRGRFRHHGYSATNAGGIVMALGIFIQASLPHLLFYSRDVSRVLALETFIIWLFLLRSYLASAINRHFRMHILHPLRRFSMGTWVAGTAVVAMVLHGALPEIPLLAEALACFAILLFIPYAVLVLWGYFTMLGHEHSLKANGAILFATVATQAILLAAHDLFPLKFPHALTLGLMIAAIVLLCIGVFLIARHFHVLRSWALAMEWKNANCIIHGAVSITGLALLDVLYASDDILMRVWSTALVLFIVVEFIEFIRMVEREYRRGLRSGLLIYDNTQWTRNFTYGMFYAFSLGLYQNPSELLRDSWMWLPLQYVAHWGQYVVLVLLLIEIGLFARARLLHWPVTRRPATN